MDPESNAEIHVVHVRPSSTAVPARTAVESGVRAGFGVAALVTEVMLRALGDASTGVRLRVTRPARWPTPCSASPGEARALPVARPRSAYG